MDAAVGFCHIYKSFANSGNKGKKEEKECMALGYLRSASPKICFSATTIVAGTTNTRIESSIDPR